LHIGRLLLRGIASLRSRDYGLGILPGVSPGYSRVEKLLLSYPKVWGDARRRRKKS